MVVGKIYLNVLIRVDVGTVLTKCPASFKTDGNNSSRNEGNSSNGLSTVLQTDNGSVKGLVNKKSEKCITPESYQKQEFNNSVETGVSPLLSSDSKIIDGDCSDPNSNNRVRNDYTLTKF